MIFVRGQSLRISSAASRPPRFGIAMSRRRTSGRSSTQRSIACRPSSASPTTSMSSAFWRRALTPSRMRAWSSAITTRVLGMEDLFWNRNLERDVRAVAGRGVEAHLPAEDLHAFAHAEETEAAACLRRQLDALRVEPPAVVLDLDEQPLLVGGDLQEDVLGLRVAGHVEERLLHDPEDRGRDVPGRSEEHTSELQSPCNLVCRLLLEK